MSPSNHVTLKIFDISGVFRPLREQLVFHDGSVSVQ